MRMKVGNIEVDTPECDKQVANRAASQAIGQFLEWLGDEQKLSIGTPHEHDDDACDRHCGNYGCGIPAGYMLLDTRSIERLLADYFGIDLQKLDAEKREILHAFNETQKSAAATA